MNDSNVISLHKEADFSIGLEDYATFCETTAFYPAPKSAEYLALGLAGEVGEVAELLLSHGGTHAGFLKELGDVQWYVARLCHRYMFDFADMVRLAHIAFEDDTGNPLLQIAVLKMSAAAGTLADKTKKLLRDGDNWTGEDIQLHVAAMRQKIHDVLVATLFAIRGINRIYQDDVRPASYYTVLTVNYRKLRSRQERGTLAGSGNDR